MLAKKKKHIKRIEFWKLQKKRTSNQKKNFLSMSVEHMGT